MMYDKYQWYMINDNVNMNDMKPVNTSWNYIGCLKHVVIGCHVLTCRWMKYVCSFL